MSTLGEPATRPADDRGASPAAREQRAKRFRVHLAVRYEDDGHRVSAFADNVSQGGLFIVGAQTLKPLTVIALEVALPGGSTFAVPAEVRHILDEAAATRTKRRAGAGVMFQGAPKAFTAALTTYLFRLTRREEVGVLVTDDSSEHLLLNAGYLVQHAPSAETVGEAIQGSLKPIIAVVVRSAEEAAYRAALRPLGAEALVVALESVDELERTLAILDQRLAEDPPLGLHDDPGDAPAWLEAIPDEGDPSEAPPPSGAPSAAVAARPAPTAAAVAPRPDRSRGPSVPFVVILTLLALALGFAIAFSLYYDRATSYPRRSTRAWGTNCPPCAAPATPRRPPPPPAPR